MQFIIENIWLILGVLVVVVGGGGAWLFMSGGMNRLLDWFRPNSDKFIPAKVFCEDNQIRDRKLKVERYAVTDEKNHRSYHLVHDLLLRKKGSTTPFLALTQRDDFPIDFHARLTKADREKYPTAQRVFIDTTADIRSNAARESAKNAMGMSLSIIAMMGGLVFVVMAIIMFWGKGGVS